MTLGLLILVSGCDSEPKGRVRQVRALGIKTETMEIHSANQQGSMWCWAACIQMALSTKGIDISQTEIVERTYGVAVDAPGTPFQIEEQLSGWLVGPRGRRVLQAAAFEGPPSYELLAQSLEDQSPIILGVSNPHSNIGHAVLITAAIFGEDLNGNLVLERVLIRDPDPSLLASHGKRELTPGEFQDAFFHVVLDVVPRR